MSSSTTPVSEARAFVRGQRFALATLASTPREEIARIAFSATGAVLLGDDIPPLARQFEPTRLLIGTTDCFAAIEGHVASHFDDADRRRFQTLHPGFALRWALEPDVVLWHTVEEGSHAFLAGEWLVRELRDEDAASELVHAVNHDHREALDALVEDLTGRSGTAPRLVDIDAEGVLVETRDALFHVHANAICPNATSTEDAIHRLVRNTRFMDPGRRAACAAEAGRGISSSTPGGGFGSGDVRSEGHFGHHGYVRPNPPWRLFSLRTGRS